MRSAGLGCSVLRLKRLAVLGLFAFCAITACAFWLLGLPGSAGPGAGMPKAQQAPPQAAGKFVPLASGSARRLH